MSHEPTFFQTPAGFRAWLKRHHKKAREIYVGYYKKKSGKPSMTWPESVAEALCYGWIDGIRRSHDQESYKIRFTPRRARSVWSRINVQMVIRLEAEGRMTSAGLAVFHARPESQKEGYTATTRHDVSLDAARQRIFKRDKAAWKFFESQPPGYRRNALYWIMSAKQDATRDKRLAKLIEASGQGKRIM